MRYACISMIAMLAPCSYADQVCVVPNTPIPDNAPGGITIPVMNDAGASELIESIEVALEITHPWVGDLVVTLTSPSGTSITLLDRPGIPSTGVPGPFGCGGRDLDAEFSDDASVFAEDVCSYSAMPVIAGPVIPVQSLSSFKGEPALGEWVLHVSDHSAYDSGVVVQVCLSTTITIACSPDLNGDGVLNFFDVSVFLNAFNTMNPVADFTNDGEFNFFDVSSFLSAYNTGCP